MAETTAPSPTDVPLAVALREVGLAMSPLPPETGKPVDAIAEMNRISANLDQSEPSNKTGRDPRVPSSISGG